MLKPIFRIEWLSAKRDAALWVVVAVFLALGAYATMVGARFERSEQAARGEALAEEATRRAALQRESAGIEAGAAVNHAANPQSPLQVGRDLFPRVAAQPSGPLAVVAVGQRDVLPQTVLLTTKTRVGNPKHQEEPSPLRQANGPFDLAFLLLFLWPLAVIALSYDLLSGERERGTLAMVLSQPITLAAFVGAKALPRALLLAALVLLIGIGGPVAVGALETGPGAALRVALYAGLLLGYTLFWLSLAVLVNAVGRSSAANALTLVGAWLALLVVIPGLASVAVDSLYPSPSRVELVNLERSAAREAAAEESALEGNHGKDQKETSERRAVAQQLAVEQQLLPVTDRFRAQRAKQQALVSRLRFLSPALLMNEGLADLADAGIARHEDFSSQVDSFHDELKAYFFDAIARDEQLTAAHYEAMPSFSYREPPPGLLAMRVAQSLLALLLLTGALMALAWNRLRRAQHALKV